MTLLYILITSLVLFFVVIAVVNLWVRYRVWHDDALVTGRIYNSRRMLVLYFKCWSIIMSGLLLAWLFDWLMMYLPETLYNLTVEFRILFYVLCGLLTFFSLWSVVNGEALVELRLRSAENENQLLRSQLNPHFLYNTLNNIDALIWLDQERASSAITNLSSLMRYFTYSGRQDTVEIGEEVSHLSQLVELQRLRMPKPEALVFEVELDHPKQEVAPLLLLPLVENCFKHCGDLNEERAIVIQVQLKEGVLRYHSDNNLKVVDTDPTQGTEATKHQPHGLGMRVLRRRLDLLYSNRFTLSLGKQDETQQQPSMPLRFITDLTVKLQSVVWAALLALSMLFADGQVCRAQSQIGDVEHNFQYQPDGNALVCVNGKNRFTRALYGGNTAFRLETSDRPEFVVTNGKKGMNLRCYAKVDGKEFALDSTDICEARYDARQRVYILKDARLGGGIGTLTLTAIATKKGEGALWKFEANGIGRHLVIEMRRHNIKAKKLSRSGDMGLESPGYFDAAGSCLQSVEIRPSKGEYIYIENDTLYVLDKKRGNQMYDEAYAACNALADNISISTPDVYLNPLGGAMMMAADGTWDGKVWNHGAVGWRMPLPGWRGAYMGDFLGMFERQRTHLDAYAKSQVTDVPVTQPHLMDSTHNLARGTYQWGTPLYSNGYICRNPENNHQMHHYDMNLVYVDELLWHFQFDADTAYMRQMWPLLERHLAWEKNTFDPDGDHLYDAYCCIWASDALQYSGGAGTHSSAYNYRGNLLAALIAEHIGEDPVPYREEAAAIRQAMNERLWVEDADNKLEKTGHWAEYQDFLGNRLVHKHPALWSLYTPIDCGVCTPEQSFACTRYIDRFIPHIGFEDGKRYQTISTSSWAPYEWSLNNVVFAEVMHTALAYYLSGRADAAYELLSGCVADFMYMGNSPANFGQLSALDVSTGERYRDFADGIGMASRALIQGLFGITPQALEGKCIVRPGFPSSWEHASIKTPYLSYSFERKEGKDIFTITQNFAQPLRIVIRQNLENGQYRDYEFDTEKQQTISIPTYMVQESGDRTLKPLSANKGCDFAEVEGARCQMIDIDNALNAQVTDIFNNKYLSPRSPYTTLALPTQGIGDWCATKRTANIDDSGIRKEALENGQVFRASMGTTEAGAIPFRTTDAGRNVAYMSLWDNYPDSITFAIAGRASHAYLMMVGSTNPMQSQFDNALVYVTYADGTTDSLTLRNPDNWCPIEQDYTHDGRAFRLPEPLPYRFSLKTGKVSRTLAKELNHGPVSLTSDVPSQKHPVYKIEGGAGQLLDLPLNPNKELRTLTVKTIANDVVIGLMAITLQRP